MTIDAINQALQELDLVEPLINFEEPGPLKTGHFEALALMYANENYRNLLTKLYNDAVKTAALRSHDLNDMVFGKAQALVYKKLLIDAKKAFEHAEKLIRIKQDGK